MCSILNADAESISGSELHDIQHVHAWVFACLPDMSMQIDMLMSDTCK